MLLLILYSRIKNTKNGANNNISMDASPDCEVYKKKCIHRLVTQII